MHFGSSIELYLTMFAWHLYGGIWDILASTGIAILPFIIITIQVLLKSSEKSNKMQDGSVILKSLEIPIYTMLFVVLVGVMPTINLYLENMTETRLECTSEDSTLYGSIQQIKRDIESRQFGKTNTTYDDDASLIITLENKVPQAPLWFYFFHQLSQAVTLSATNVLPCNPDLRALRADVSYLNINDQLLRSETSQFLRDCWRPAANKFFREQPETTIPNINDDITWAGSSFFMTTPGYYDKSFAQENLASFPFNYGPDAYMPNKENPGAIAENRGFPFCHHWWQHPEYGLRGRLLEDINIYFNSRSSFSGYAEAIKARFNGDREDMENALLRTALSAETRLSGQQVANSYTREAQGGGTSITDDAKYVTSTIGLAMKTFGSSTESFIYRSYSQIWCMANQAASCSTLIPSLNFTPSMTSANRL